MKTFREAFCQHYGCASEEFTRKVFLFCAVHRNKFFLKVAWWWEPRSVIEAVRIIEEVGETTALSQLHDIFTDYRHTIHDLGLADSKYRLSTKSVTDVFKIVHGIELS